MFDKQYLITKIKSFNNKTIKKFYGKVFKGECEWICLLLIVIYSVFKSSKNYYQPTLLEESKYKIKEKKIKLFITDYLESSCDDDSEKNILKKMLSDL